MMSKVCSAPWNARVCYKAWLDTLSRDTLPVCLSTTLSFDFEYLVDGSTASGGRTRTSGRKASCRCTIRLVICFRSNACDHGSLYKPVDAPASLATTISLRKKILRIERISTVDVSVTFRRYRYVRFN